MDCRRAKTTPTMGNASHGCMLVKIIGKAAMQSQRTIHVVCPLRKSFYGGFVKEGTCEKDYDKKHPPVSMDSFLSAGGKQL